MSDPLLTWSDHTAMYWFLRELLHVFCIYCIAPICPYVDFFGSPEVKTSDSA